MPSGQSILLRSTLSGLASGLCFSCLLRSCKGKVAVTGRLAGRVGAWLPVLCGLPYPFNAALLFRTATRGALALSIIPLISVVVAAILGVEALTARKTVGVAVASLGVASALVSGFALAPDGAWRGDLLMLAGAFSFAFYNVLSRPFVRRSGLVSFTTMAMGIGALCLIAISLARGSFMIAAEFGSAQWFAMGYLGVIGSGLTFVLWAFALTRTTQTRVAISVTLIPVTASLLGNLLLGERLGWNLLVGLGTVFLGIWIATTTPPVQQ
jgi:drug/metabolite transporter (DMT)-like permease